MKYLYLIRHAKASDEYNRIQDFDRPLKTKGILQAHQMATKLKSKGIKAEAILSSTASRALQTAHIFAIKNDISFANIIHDVLIYEANVDNLIKSVAQIDDQINHLFMFGHNPSITHFANYLLDSFMTEIPVCGVVCIKIDSDNWKDIHQHKNHLIFFDIPDKIEEKVISIVPPTEINNTDAPKI